MAGPDVRRRRLHQHEPHQRLGRDRRSDGRRRRLLANPGGLLALYGPYREADTPLAPSNAAFDASLKARDPAWGLRDRDEVVALAKTHRLHLTRRIEMPANNIMLLFRRVG